MYIFFLDILRETHVYQNNFQDTLIIPKKGLPESLRQN